uniref:hypothetical protein n=1 Tax=Rhodococcus qingshengii TaxID=334542 RepID=UPI001C4E04A2|nr:hypothetical protein [Rhodococcus qingshengii]
MTFMSRDLATLVSQIRHILGRTEQRTCSPLCDVQVRKNGSAHSSTPHFSFRLRIEFTRAHTTRVPSPAAPKCSGKFKEKKMGSSEGDVQLLTSASTLIGIAAGVLGGVGAIVTLAAFAGGGGFGS